MPTPQPTPGGNVAANGHPATPAATVVTKPARRRPLLVRRYDTGAVAAGIFWGAVAAALFLIAKELAR